MPDSHSDFMLTSMLRRQTYPGWEIKPRFINCCELVLILNGFGDIKINGKEYCAKSGDLYLFHENVEHSLQISREPYMAFYGVHFTHSNESLNLPDVIHLNNIVNMEILFNQLYDLYSKKEYLYQWRMDVILQLIIIEMFTIVHNDYSPHEMLRMRRVIEYIRENLYSSIRMDDLLLIAGLKKSAFITSFRNVTGKTPAKYIIQMRLDSSKALLEKTDDPINCIAEQCGFSDSLYYSRCFRKHFGMSPSQYRKLRL